MGLNTFFTSAVFLTYCLVLVHCIRRPVIGVLMQKYSHNNISSDHTDYVIFSNYVKAVEGSGAMVVPIMINQDISYYREILTKINGLVLPGGAADLQDPTDIGRAGGIIYKLAEELNDKGVHFPILGVCQGFQLLTEASAGMAPLLTPCKGLTNVGLSLKFVMNPFLSHLYRNAPKEVIEILKKEPVTANVHHFCVTRKTLEDYDLTSTWRVITVDRDDDGMQFITSMEHTRYPFAAVQFHPEKTIYDLAEGFKFQTDYKAILANRWFYDWVVEESKKNDNRFPNGTSADHIMENYCPTLGFVPRVGVIEKYLFSIPNTNQNQPLKEYTMPNNESIETKMI